MANEVANEVAKPLVSIKRRVHLQTSIMFFPSLFMKFEGSPKGARGGIPGEHDHPLGEMSKFKFCGPCLPHSLTKSNYIVCDLCRSLAELLWLFK